MPEIKFTSGPMEGRILNLSAQKYTIGRKPDRDLFFNDESCSGEHAELRLEGGEWKIVDLQSFNGTWLNKKKVTTAVLSSGDSVRVGVSIFVFGGTEKQVQQNTSEGEAPVVASTDELALVEKMRGHADRIRREVGKVIVGQADVLEQILMCILAGGHALLIGLPGMAKTLTVKTIAQVLNLKFKRVQFTPDLMPGDIIGTDVLETNTATGEKEFRFIRGPIFCNLLLADEINRTPPKTQAALLEAMQEKMVTAGNTSYTLAEPFFVLATQNPIEQEGTYPLPEAQLDRFMFNIWVDYPLPHEDPESDDRRGAGRAPAGAHAGGTAPAPGGGPQSPGVGSCDQIRDAPGRGDAPAKRRRAAGHQDLCQHGSGAPGWPVPDSGGEGYGDSGRPYPCELRRHPACRAPGFAPPASNQFRGGFRGAYALGHCEKAPGGGSRARRRGLSKQTAELKGSAVSTD